LYCRFVFIRPHSSKEKDQQTTWSCESIVDAGYDIGIDVMTGKPTSIFTIITNDAGKLITSFPGVPGR
jgi:hypothetical protein